MKLKSVILTSIVIVFLFLIEICNISFASYRKCIAVEPSRTVVAFEDLNQVVLEENVISSFIELFLGNERVVNSRGHRADRGRFYSGGWCCYFVNEARLAVQAIVQVNTFRFNYISVVAAFDRDEFRVLRI